MKNQSPADLLRAETRIAAIREDISGRLWSVNQGMCRVSFNELMDNMALLQFNFERRIAEEGMDGDRRIGQADRRTLFAQLDPKRVTRPVPQDGESS